LADLHTETRAATVRMEFEREALSAESRMAYLAATEPFGAASLNIGAVRTPTPTGGRGGGQAQAAPVTVEAQAYLMLDGRRYVWRAAEAAPPYLAQVQDEAGLINLYDADVLQLTRLFSRLGLEQIDAENLANELVAYNLDPTAHVPMRKPAELFRL